MSNFDIVNYQDGYPVLESMSSTEYANVFGMSLRQASRYLLKQTITNALCRAKHDWHIPWDEHDVTTLAKETGTMRVYFMSNESQSVWRGNINDTEGKNWGDCTLFAFPNGQTMLVDVGMEGNSRLLIPNLQSLGVTTIDYLVLTHPHDDHCYGLTDSVNVLNSFDVRHVYYTGAHNKAWENENMIEELCLKYGIPLSTLSCGDSLDIGEVHVDVVSPLRDVIGKYCEGNDGVNAVSIVMRLKYKDRAVLMTGDTNYMQEERFVTDFPELLKADVLKIQHHGAWNSNTQAFADAVKPLVCYNMAWKDIEPHIFKRYSDLGAKVYSDLTDGYLKVVTDGKDISWETSRERLPEVDRYYELACKDIVF
ncbi:MAG: MBL fold metallo-hydrolase [Sphaerochaetaceae bacterium]|nr:MBL fold metallo-hydrolase [Sphaerochaetaceae bacterium]